MFLNAIKFTQWKKTFYKNSYRKPPRTMKKKYQLKLSTYIRNIRFEKELKINEFQTDEFLLEYGTYFKKITNLLRNREWNVFENKKEILVRVENLIELIHQYLYSKIQKNE